MRAFPILAALMGLVFVAHGASAADPATNSPKANPDEERVRAALAKRVPEAKIEAVHKSKIPGLYEVVLETEIAWTDSDANVLFLGRQIDTQSRIDLGAERWNELHAVDLDKLPLDLAIKTVRGDGSRKLAVFADPLCPYCQQLEQNLAGVSDVTIYTFLMPLESVHPGATARARQIWCAPDRAEAWSKWMLARVEPTKGACDGDPIAKVLEISDQHSIGSTPTLVFSSGRRLSGALPRPDLERMISGQPLAPPRAN